jgi:NitT/TauT family transport system substrate-binding protein
MTNMDTLTTLSAPCVNITALITADFSNDNDAVVLKGRDSTQNIKGVHVYLLELLVSHYTLARALEMAVLSERDITVVNTLDADIATAFTTHDGTVLLWAAHTNLTVVFVHPLKLE